MRAFGPDVIHAHEPLTPSTSMLAVRATGAPVVATFHASLGRSRLMEVASPLLSAVYRRVDAGIAVSEAAAAFLARAIPGEVDIVPNGLDVDRFAHPGPPAEGMPPGRLLLWVGRLDPQKGFPVLIRAFARLADAFPDLWLLVAGDGRDRGAAGSLPEAVRRRVRMLGAVRHEDLPPYHAAAEVFVSSATARESFGYVLVEAMAAGLPVVATDIAGYREVVRDGVEGLLVPPNDPDALARALARILSDPGLAARLGVAGRERARGFAWDFIVPRIEAIYRRVTGSPA